MTTTEQIAYELRNYELPEKIISIIVQSILDLANESYQQGRIDAEEGR
jgi:hypothetical protein